MKRLDIPIEKAALLLKSHKIQLAILLFLVVLDLLVTPSVWNFAEHLIERKKSFGHWHSPLTFEYCFVNQKFGLSVSSVWSPGLIEKLTISKWPCDFQKVGTASQVASYILDFVFDEEPESEKFEVELFCFDMLLINKFYIKKYILCWLNKIMLGNPCTNF